MQNSIKKGIDDSHLDESKAKINCFDAAHAPRSIGNIMNADSVTDRRAISCNSSIAFCFLEKAGNKTLDID